MMFSGWFERKQPAKMALSDYVHHNRAEVVRYILENEQIKTFDLAKSNDLMLKVIDGDSIETLHILIPHFKYVSPFVKERAVQWLQAGDYRRQDQLYVSMKGAIENMLVV